MIFVKVSYAKGLNAAGMILFTVQLLVHFFDYIVNSISVFTCILDNWTCILGYVLLGVMFIKKKKISTDYILTIIGLLLWFSRFMKVFSDNNGEPVLSFIICSAGILGSVVVFIGLVFELAIAKQNNDLK